MTAESTLTALGEPTRQAIVTELRSGPRAPTDLATSLGVPRTVVSQHLRVLRSSGLVDARIDPQDARVRHYQLRPDNFLALQAWLDQLAAGWRDQLDAFKAHVESEPNR